MNAQRWHYWLFHGLLFVLLVLLGWLTHHYGKAWDWSDNQANSLSNTTQTLLKRLQKPLVVTSFVVENPPLRQTIQEVIARYQRYRSDIEFYFVNPDIQPDVVRKLGVRVQGELRLTYDGKSEFIQHLNEENISNAIQRLIQRNDRWVVATTGHGERSLYSAGGSALASFNKELENKGYHTQSLNVAAELAIPSNTNLLLIASPVIDFLPQEVQKIRQYLDDGGNLFWLMEPDGLQGLDDLAKALGISRLAGTVLDANAKKAGLASPAMALALSYPSDHPVTKDFDQLTVYPHAVALSVETTQGWQSQAIISTLSGTWNETGEIKGNVSYDAETEQAGPLTLAIALNRGHQRVLVVGDGDFLSDAALGKGGNMNLGLNMIRWLNDDDNLLNIPARTRHDRHLVLQKMDTIVIGIGFLFIMPFLLFMMGLIIRWRRHRA